MPFASPRRLVPAAALAALVTACAVPNPPPSEDLRAQSMPNVKLAPQWTGAPADAGEVPAGWLARFGDPGLTAIVAEAMAYNSDIQIAAARMEAAAANARAAGAAIWPQLNLQGRGGGELSGDSSGLQGLGLFASWEIDLWGRVRAMRASGSAAYEATELDWRYARESIAAMIAKNWFMAREAALQGAIAGEMVDDSQALLGLARDRLRIGKGDEYDVSQADAAMLSYRDLQLQADIARLQALRSIEILAGRYPSGVVDPGSGLPPPGSVPVGLPSQLLERRYDVRAAERRVAAAFYRTHEAQAARLPRISLVASVSTISSELIVLKERDNPAWGLGGTLFAPLFHGGALQAQVEVRTADQKAAVADYARMGLRAFNEVEGALSQSFNLERRVEVLERSVQANQRSLGFARVRYDVGSGDQRGVHERMLSLHTTRASLLRAQSERLIQRVNLFLALGGGFEATP